MSLRRPTKPCLNRRRLRCESLEDRRLLAIYTVDSIEDSGPGTLREAIGLANATLGVADEIVFDAALFSTPQTIAIDSQLPTITDELMISGPGADLLTIDAQHGADGEAATGDGWRILEVDDGSFATDMQVTLSGLKFANADHDDIGGAILNRGNLRIDSVVFAGNHVWGDGGAVYDDGVLEVTQSQFIGNTADKGGGLYTRGANVSTTLFESNNASRGGAIYAAGPAQLLDSAIVDNTATYGAGVWITGRVAIEGVTISGNRADEGAALIFNGTGFNSSTVSHSTIVRNINLRSFSSLGAAYSAAVGLDPPFLGGQANRVRFTNSIVAETVDGNGEPAYDVTAGPFSFTHSLLGTGNPDFDGVDGNRIGGVDDDRLLADFEPLGYYGGPTPTHPLQANSPALDAGDPAIALGGHDQRGTSYARVVDGGGGLRVDMGAYESQAPSPEARLGDFNADGRFDAADYTIWRDHRGTTVAPFTLGDATGDGIVDEIDRTLWHSRYGERYVTGLVVDSLDDDDDGDIYNGRTTLREAINFSRDNPRYDEITFDPSLTGGVIEVGSSGFYYQIESALTIDARMVPGGITLDAGGRTTGLHVNAFNVSTDNDFDVTLAGLTIRNGVGQFGGGGAVNSLMNGTLTLINTTMIDNASGDDSFGYVTGSGGAIYAHGPVVLIDSVIDGAEAGASFGGSGGSGGGIFAVGDVTLVRSHILNVVGLRLRGGGGIVAANYAPSFPQPARTERAPNVTLTDSSITAAQGGGIATPGDVLLVRSSLEGGTGPGIVAQAFNSFPATGNVVLIDSTVRGFTSQLADRANGSSDGGYGSGVVADGNVSLTRSRIENNHVESNGDANPDFTAGGGIAAGGTVSLLDSHVSGNSAGQGGGIYAEGRDAEPGEHVVSIIGSAVNDNTSRIGASGIQSRGSIWAEQSSVSRNHVTEADESSDGPATAVLAKEFWNGGTPTLNLVDSVVAGNRTSTTYPGPPLPIYAVYGYYVGATVVRSHIIDNESNGVFAASVVDSIVSRNTGVGIRAANFDLTIDGSVISGNQFGIIGDRIRLTDSIVRGNVNRFESSAFNLGFGGLGAGVVGSFFVELERSIVAENILDHGGTAGDSRFNGSAGVTAGSLSAIDSTIRDNQTIGDHLAGGGVMADRIELFRTTISGNTTDSTNAHGGGLYGESSVTLVQSTVSNNRTLGATSHGGGIYTGVLTTSSSTIAENETTAATSEGGGAYLTSSQLFDHTLIAGNTAAVGPDVRSDGGDDQIIDYSVIGNTSGLTVHNATNSLLDIDPLLGPLAANGGPTLTHALLPGSPAIDAGNPSFDPHAFSPPLTNDQRGTGFNRLSNTRIDIGAFERQAAAPFSGEANGGGTVDMLDLDILNSGMSALAAATEPSLKAAFALLSTESSAFSFLRSPVANTIDDDILLLIATACLNASEAVDLPHESALAEEAAEGAEADETVTDVPETLGA